jgi:hypothetical protein
MVWYPLHEEGDNDGGQETADHERRQVNELPPSAWAALTAIVGAFAGWLTTRSKNEADATAVMSETFIEWTAELRDETTRTRQRLAEVEAENELIRERLVQVEREVVDCENRYDRLALFLRANGFDVDDEVGGG